MNVSQMENHFLKEHSDCLQTIADISKDRANQSVLCDHKSKLFFCFDDIVQKYYKSSSSMPSSPDMIIFNKDKDLIVLVEFKNGRMDSKNVKLKLFETLLFIFPKILELNCSDALNNTPIAYLLIYNYDKNPDKNTTIEQISRDVSSMPSRFGIGILKDKCIDSVKYIKTYPCHHSIYDKLIQYGYKKE
ncbi:MAG: hypothetical protein QM493_02420 [Sulfurovum sp.]